MDQNKNIYYHTTEAVSNLKKLILLVKFKNGQ